MFSSISWWESMLVVVLLETFWGTGHPYILNVEYNIENKMSRTETSIISYVTQYLFSYVGHQMRGSAQDVGVNLRKPFILPLPNHFKLPIFRPLHSHSAAPFGFYVGHHFEIPGTPSCITACLLPSNGWRIWILVENGKFGNKFQQRGDALIVIKNDQIPPENWSSWSNTGNKIFSRWSIEDLKHCYASFDWWTYYFLLMTIPLVRHNPLAVLLMAGPYWNLERTKQLHYSTKL